MSDKVEITETMLEMQEKIIQQAKFLESKYMTDPQELDSIIARIRYAAERWQDEYADEILYK